LKNRTSTDTVLGMETLRRCLQFLEEGCDVLLITVLQASRGTPGKEGFKLALASDGRRTGTVGGGALEHRALADAQELLGKRQNALVSYNLADLGMRCGGETTLAFEFLPGQRGFLLFGGGHIGLALAPMLEALGFRVTVYDSRPEMREALQASPASNRTVLIGEYADLAPARERLEAVEFCFIATHGHQHDYVVLKQVLQSPGRKRYIGLIGSRAKVRHTRERLAEEGIQVPDSLYAPVGLDLGAQTPAEIAVAVAAEVVAVLHGTAAAHMRDRTPG
jgi:xanthine dehydrogenase accessory factor